MKMDWKKLNVEIKIPTKIKRLLILVIGTVCLTNILVGIMDYFSVEIYRAIKFFVPIITAIPSFVIYKIEGKKIKDLFAGKIIYQLLCGIALGGILICLAAVIGGGLNVTVEAALFERHVWYRIYIAVYYLLIVGFMEEFIYRIVMQDYLVGMLGKAKILAPCITAVAFSLCHYSAGGIDLLVHVFVWGMIWGYLRYFNKKVSYLALAVSHGVYDFGLLIIPLALSWF